MNISTGPNPLTGTLEDHGIPVSLPEISFTQHLTKMQHHTTETDLTPTDLLFLYGTSLYQVIPRKWRGLCTTVAIVLNLKVYFPGPNGNFKGISKTSNQSSITEIDEEPAHSLT